MIKKKVLIKKVIVDFTNFLNKLDTLTEFHLSDNNVFVTDILQILVKCNLRDKYAFNYNEDLFSIVEDKFISFLNISDKKANEVCSIINMELNSFLEVHFSNEVNDTTYLSDSQETILDTKLIYLSY